MMETGTTTCCAYWPSLHAIRSLTFFIHVPPALCLPQQSPDDDSGMDFSNVDDMYAALIDRLEAVDQAAPSAIGITHAKNAKVSVGLGDAANPLVQTHTCATVVVKDAPAATASRTPRRQGQCRTVTGQIRVTATQYATVFSYTCATVVDHAV